MAFFLENGAMASFIGILAEAGAVHGPLLNESGVFAFGKISNDPAFLRLDYQRTLIPPKKYLLPPVEITHTFAKGTGYQASPKAAERIALLGIHHCDLVGIAYLDHAFLQPPIDEHYRQKRARLFLVGLSCKPDQFCFCADNNLPPTHDLFLWKRDGGFIVTAGSSAGESSLKAMRTILQHVPEDREESSGCDSREAAAIREAFARNDHFAHSPLWSDFAARCLSCGACSMCCPTCYCFDVRESGNLDGSAHRTRSWDNCLFRSHGEIAGGENFRRRREQRFQYRHQHKYLGFGPVRGTISCVGCGRCREVCPVRIDLLELFGEQEQGGAR